MSDMKDFKREDDGPSAEETELGTVLTTNPEYNLTHGQNQLERGLKSRHIQFLALGMLFFLAPGAPIPNSHLSEH